MSWIVSSNLQLMAVGANGPHGSHAAWRVEGETEHVLARALNQRRKWKKWMALGQISPQKAAICTSVKVDVFIWIFFIFLNVYMTDIFWFAWWILRHNIKLSSNRDFFFLICFTTLKRNWNYSKVSINSIFHLYSLLFCLAWNISPPSFFFGFLF